MRKYCPFTYNQFVAHFATIKKEKGKKKPLVDSLKRKRKRNFDRLEWLSIELTLKVMRTRYRLTLQFDCIALRQMEAIKTTATLQKNKNTASLLDWFLIKNYLYDNWHCTRPYNCCVQLKNVFVSTAIVMIEWQCDQSWIYMTMTMRVKFFDLSLLTVSVYILFSKWINDSAYCTSETPWKWCIERVPITKCRLSASFDMLLDVTDAVDHSAT